MEGVVSLGTLPAPWLAHLFIEYNGRIVLRVGSGDSVFAWGLRDCSEYGAVALTWFTGVPNIKQIPTVLIFVEDIHWRPVLVIL
jgi:hypothetical protein